MSSVAPRIDQYRVGVPLSGPTKVAGFAGPFQVINESLVNTVWLGDNPSIRSGGGIPLYPGTGLVWTGSQGTKELWAVQDSTSTVTSDLVIGDNVTDWQPNPAAVAIAVLNSGVLLVDNPTTILSSSGINGNRSFGPLDISTYQSIFVQYNISGTAHTVDLQLNWANAGGFNVDRFRWTNTDTAGLTGKQLPCRGDNLSISITLGGGVPNDSISIIASNRLWSPLNQNLVGGFAGSSGRVICTNSNAALGSGAVLTATPEFRYDGPVIITAISFGAAAAAPHIVELNDLITTFGAGYDQPNGILALGANRCTTTLHTVAPRNTWTATLQNLSAAAQQAQIQVVAAPEGT